LYFTSQATVWRTSYVAGQRREAATRDDLGMPPTFRTGGRWTHGLARSVGGKLFTARGEYGTCGANPGGEISQIDFGMMNVVAKGFRNPLYLRCHFRDELCAATELGEDQTPGAREKLVALRPGTDYGYPCCFTAQKPVQLARPGACDPVMVEDASFT